MVHRQPKSGSTKEESRLEEAYTCDRDIWVVLLRMIPDLANCCIETRCGAVWAV